jgi:hypothetical protein
MTQDEIIEMWNSVIKFAPSEVRIAEFAKLVAEKEREACAKLAYSYRTWDDTGMGIADAIRARGQGTPERGQA